MLKDVKGIFRVLELASFYHIWCFCRAFTCEGQYGKGNLSSVQHCSAVEWGNGGEQHGQKPELLASRGTKQPLFGNKGAVNQQRRSTMKISKLAWVEQMNYCKWRISNMFVCYRHVALVVKQRVFVLLACWRHGSGCMAGGSLFG